MVAAPAMEPFCLRHTDLPGTTRLFADYLYSFQKLKPFYGQDPHDFESFRRAAAAVEYPEDRRRAMVDALRSRNEGSPLLEKLGQAGTVAVVTGQQVGLYGGPLYSVYKALTAVHVAHLLDGAGIPAVPVFWLATEDHDFAEIAQFHLLDAKFEMQSVEIQWPAEDHQPVGWAKPGEYPNEALASMLAGYPFAGEVQDLVRAAYQPGRPLGQAFQALMSGILGRFQMLYVDPLETAVRAVGNPILSKAAASGGALTGQVVERGKALEAAGYHAQVHVEASTSMVFRLENERRVPLKVSGGVFSTKDRKWTAAELASEPEKLSPNALLRPVMQDYMLPTVAYVGGPAEIAYFGQGEVLYRELLGRMPVMLSRAFFTLIDSRSQTIMQRHHVSLPELCTNEAAMRERFAAKLVPPSLEGELQQRARRIEAEADGIREALCGFDPTLEKAMVKSHAKITHQLEKMRAKAAREALRRDQAATSDAAYLYRSLYPHLHLQERYFGALPYLARYGPALIDTVYSHVSMHCPDHIVLPV